MRIIKRWENERERRVKGREAILKRKQCQGNTHIEGGGVERKEMATKAKMR
jgi:hypothetical protein